MKIRHRMADRLIASHELMGRSRQEVVDKLGPPLQTNYFAEWDMRYHLGAERGFMSIDSEWLLLRLSESGVVVEASLGRD